MLTGRVVAAHVGAADSIATIKAQRHIVTKVCGISFFRESNQTILEQYLDQTASGCGPWSKFDTAAATAMMKRALAREFTHLTGCTDKAKVQHYLWEDDNSGQDLGVKVRTSAKLRAAGGDTVEAVRRFWRDIRNRVPGLSTSMKEGQELWVEDISRSTPDEMRAMQAAVIEDEEMSEDETLAFHFTTVASAKTIFGKGSIGIRASSAGIGGAGVYVCPTPLHILGWEQFGNSWRERVGRALWGENWSSVLLGEQDADKIEVVLVLKVAKSMVSQYTRERPHAAVLKRRLLLKDSGHGWFPKSEIVKVWGLANDHEGATLSEAEMRRVFEAADVDASGDLSHQEVKDLLAERGLNCTDGYVEGVFESYDADSSGTIDYSEFEQLSKLVQRRLENGGGYSKPATQSAFSTKRRSKTPPRSFRPAGRAAMAAAKFERALREPPALPVLAQSVARVRGSVEESPEPLRDPPGLPESEPVATLAELAHTLDLNELSLTDVDLLRGEAGGAHEWVKVDQLLAKLEVSASDMKCIKKALMWRWRTETEQLAASAQSQRDFAERKAAQLKEDAQRRP